MTQQPLTHATIETFPTPGGCLRFFAAEGKSHTRQDPYVYACPVCWLDAESIEIKGVSQPWTLAMLKLAIKAAGDAGAKRIGFVRVRPSGESHTKWYQTGG